MNSFYEHRRDTNEKITVLSGGHFVFPAHFHHHLELFIMKKGNISISCNGKNYDLNGGSIAFFNSYNIHSYFAQPSAILGYCIIIPTECAVNFTKRNKNKSIISPVIRKEKLCDEIYDLVQRYLISNDSEDIKNNCIELILSLIEKHLNFIPTKSDEQTTTLVKKILMYINDNFKSDVSLKTLSKILGYSDAHISRIFSLYVKKSLPDYVNELRFKEVNRLIENTNGKITDLIFDAGFNSIQTYYRVKSKLTKN